MQLRVFVLLVLLLCSWASCSSVNDHGRYIGDEEAFPRFMSSAVPLRYTDYKADSGGCLPLTRWEDEFKYSKWWNWEARLPNLAAKLQGLSDGTRAAKILKALGHKHIWLQIVDGWAHPKGRDAFGHEYVDDMNRAFDVCAELLKKSGLDPVNFNEPFYAKIHFDAFKQTAALLSKRNGYRGPQSGVYLPLPDKPLGVFHDIHEKGQMMYDPKLRMIDRNGAQTAKWKYNEHYLMRWVYPNLEIKFAQDMVASLFKQFWDELAAISPQTPEGEQRETKLFLVVKLYHALENFHSFIDGNGRTNILVLDTLLSWVGLHPVLFYNSMESALASVAEMREKVLEGYYMWEQAILNIELKAQYVSGWTLEAIKKKNKECKASMDALFGRGPPPEDLAGVPAFVADTEGGCLCLDAQSCEQNRKFNDKQWCYTTPECTWKWDFCAPGRPSTRPNFKRE